MFFFFLVRDVIEVGVPAVLIPDARVLVEDVTLALPPWADGDYRQLVVRADVSFDSSPVLVQVPFPAGEDGPREDMRVRLPGFLGRIEQDAVVGKRRLLVPAQREGVAVVGAVVPACREAGMEQGRSVQ